MNFLKVAKELLRDLSRRHFFGGRIVLHNMLPEDPTLIANKIRELNGEVRTDWFALPGLHAFTKFDYLQGGGAMFTPTVGYPIKVFMNGATGETRIFPAALFLQK